MFLMVKTIFLQYRFVFLTPDSFDCGNRYLFVKDAVAIYAGGGSNGVFCDGLPAQPLLWLVGGVGWSL